MKTIAIVSGKGGTGKTSMLASFATLAAEEVKVAIADCDVEAANLALLLPGTDGPAHEFFSGRSAVVDADRCTGCGLCVDPCRFDALRIEDGLAVVDVLACEGCGVCALVCPEDAFSFQEKRAGEWVLRETEAGPLVHAELGVAQDNSGKLVAEVREETKRVAEEVGAEIVLLDGPPGVGCPVHATLTGVDLIVGVTEPSGSGAHDLGRLLDLAKHFSIPAVAVLNRADLSHEGRRLVEAVADEHDVALVGTIPFDPEVPRLLAQGRLPLGSPLAGPAIRETWAAIRKHIV